MKEREIWQTANLMFKRFGDDAAIECAMRADELDAEGDRVGAAIWKQVQASVESLTGPPSGPMH